jgi:hypothetical protein
MERIALIASLRPGTYENAEELASDPPTEPMTGIERWSIFLSPTEVAFVFEGEDVEERTREWFDDPVRSRRANEAIRVCGHGLRTPLVSPSAGAAPPLRPDGVQLHLVDGRYLGPGDPSDHLSLALVVTEHGRERHHLGMTTPGRANNR